MKEKRGGILNRKNLLISMVSAFIGMGVVIGGATQVIANSDILHYVGKDNVEITVTSDKDNFRDYDQQNSTSYINTSESKSLKVGQSIVTSGIEEIIFAIGENGSYITIPVEQ